jgi:adenine-specific DNA-methyltransferase
MDKIQAQKLIAETFEQPYDETRYRRFIKELFNEIDDKNDGAMFKLSGNMVHERKAFGDYVKSYARLGKYKSPDNKEIDILAVKLARETSVERARTAQRNFIASYLNGARGGKLKDAAIVAFYHDELEQWRFSLVCMNYRLKEKEDGKIKVEQELTPARRYSFLVGVGEPSHTAQSYLFDLLKDDRNNPTLSALEASFNVEKVSDEFFEEYRELFNELTDELDSLVKKDKKIAKEFSEKDVNLPDFAKKLMGQLVFLYFIQKKGWLGVERDSKWGIGPKDFLNMLFEKKVTEYSNFFNDILEPLFYDALANERDKPYFSQLKCKIPFLNGGLFEPICGYDWKKTDIVIKNEVFKKILDTFNLYNFTVREDEPLDKEVAVDPEMLGKVFERLMEVKDRKSAGAYYTPREIVHYMCQESLINYLATEMEGKVEKQDIEDLIHIGDFAIENDTAKKEGSKTYSYDMPKAIRENAKTIDEKLISIKICDPAIGSGAFPVGMMHEIVKSRQALTPHITDKTGRNAYNFKRHAIHESIYGVDINPSAVDIAKLRLWLSLVVDEENYEEIKPLPNLDYKIMQGDSLLEEFEGVKLFDERILSKDEGSNKARKNEIKVKIKELQKQVFKLHAKGNVAEEERLKAELKDLNKALKKLDAPDADKNAQGNLLEGESPAKKKAEELKLMQQKFFEESRATEKGRLKEKIEKLIWELIEMSLVEQGKESVLEKVKQYKKSNSRPFFLWKLYFEDVFEVKGGFDVVIGNPPYIQLQKFKGDPLQNAYKQHGYTVYDSNGDIYCLFYENGLRVLKKSGVLCFITSNKWMRAAYGELLRDYFIRNNPINLIDLGPDVFTSATVDTNIIMVQKSDNTRKLKALNMNQSLSDKIDIADYVAENSFELSNVGAGPWVVGNEEEQKVNKKIEKIGKPLKEWDIKIYFGVKTGLNEAFIIDQVTYDKLVSEDKKSSKILKPILRGRDIEKYGYIWGGQWVIATFPVLGIDINEFSAVKKYLLNYGKEKLEQSGKIFKDGTKARKKTGSKWFETQDNIAYHEEFLKGKVIWKRIGSILRFGYDTKGYYGQDSTCIMTGKNLKYICAFMNSKVGQMQLFDKAPKTGTGDLIVSVQAIDPLLVPPITAKNKNIIKKIEIFVDEIFIVKKKNPDEDITHFEHKIDEQIYRLFDLIPEEIKMIETKIDVATKNIKK